MKKTILFLYALLIAGISIGQDLPRTSPSANVEQKVGLTWVTVSYARPSAKERTIWGSLVPYDTIWRTGANEPTIIIFDDDVLVGQKKVLSGQYAVFSIPEKDALRFVLNSNTAQWGSFDYDPEENVLEFFAAAKKIPYSEYLTISFEGATEDSANLCISWAERQFCMPIKANIEKKALKNIEEAIRFSEPTDPTVMINAVNYTIQSGHLKEYAKNWATEALTRSNRSWQALLVNANLSANQKNFKEAIIMGKEALEKLDKNTHGKLIDSLNLSLNSWKKKL